MMSVRDYHFIRDNVQYSGKKTKTINKLFQNKTDVISTPEPKPRRGRKFKLASGKVIPNVYYACDDVVGTCAGLVLYDHHKGGKPCGLISL